MTWPTAPAALRASPGYTACHTPRPGRETVREALEGGPTFRWLEFDAEHAFGRDIGPRFDPEATDAAFAETVAFFRRTL